MHSEFTVKIRGLGWLSWSKKTPKCPPKKSHDAHEEEIWTQRFAQRDDGTLLFPAQAVKLALIDAAKYRGDTIPGRGKATYTKHFKSGLIPLEGNVPLLDPRKKGSKPLTVKDLQPEARHVPSDGKTGGGTRVLRVFPMLEAWSAEVSFLVVDGTLTEEVVLDFLRDAGSLIGVGRFRPQNGGFHGRFSVEELTWTDVKAASA